MRRVQAIAIMIGIIAIVSYFIADELTSQESDDIESIPINVPHFNEPKQKISYVKEYQLQENVFPNAIEIDEKGTIWITDTNLPRLVHFDPASEKIIASYLINQNNIDQNDNN